MSKAKKSMAAIEKMAVKGEDVSSYFSKPIRREPLSSPPVRREDFVKDVQRVNVDFGLESLILLDKYAQRLNVTRQALIKILIKEALDQYLIADKAKQDIET